MQQPQRKGILLAGGSGTRLYPLTQNVSKHLLPVGGRPMIYYPLATLVTAGIREILLISTPAYLPAFKKLLGDGSALGAQLHYAEQPRPEGIAQAFSIATHCGFLTGTESSALILGDNLFHGGAAFKATLARATARSEGATLFYLPVDNPSDYAIIELNENGPFAIEEKPHAPTSNYAIPGLYFYDAQAPRLAAELTPSPRGELEITDLNRIYLEHGTLHAEALPPDTTWFDLGTHSALARANDFITNNETHTEKKSIPRFSGSH